MNVTGTKTAVMPIVKANAYGHGLVDVARHLVSIGATSFGVAFLEEAVALRAAGIHLPILVMGGILGAQIPVFLRHGLTLTASSIDKLRDIDATARDMGVTATVHLKIDTGMERIGGSEERFCHYVIFCRVGQHSHHVRLAQPGILFVIGRYV